MVISLLQKHGLEPKKKASTNGGEYSSPCPACGGKDRFLSWPEQGEHGTWYCRGCNNGGDVIEFLKVFDGMSYGDACKELGLASTYKQKPLCTPVKNKTKSFTPKKHEVLQDVWQNKALVLLNHAQEQLLKNSVELDNLAKRGLPLDAVKFFSLGWLLGEVRKNGHTTDCYFRARGAWGLSEQKDNNGKPKRLWIPRGIVIPMLKKSVVSDNAQNSENINTQVLRLRIRRIDADRERFNLAMKFVVLSGSCMGPLLIEPSGGAKAYVVVESELDAMATVWAAEQAGLKVGALAVGTNLGKPDAEAHAKLLQSLSILIALDFDAPDAKGRRPGAQGVSWWIENYTTAKRWPTAEGKDVGEAFALGMNIASWLKAGLTYLSSPIPFHQMP